MLQPATLLEPLRRSSPIAGPAARNRLLRGVVGLAALTGLWLDALQLIGIRRDFVPLPPDAFGVSGATPAAATLLVLSWGVGFALLALVIALRFDDPPVLMAGLFLAAFSLLTGPNGGRVAQNVLPVGTGGAMLGGLAYAVGTRFTQTFPRRLARADVVAMGAGPLRRTLLRLPAALLDARVFWSTALALEVAAHTFAHAVPDVVHVLVYCGLAVVYLTAGHRRGDGADCARIYWILEGVLVLFILEATWATLWLLQALGIASLEMTFWSDWLRIGEGWAAVLCFAMAIFHARAIDPATVLRRTAIFSMTGAVTVVVFIALEEALVDTVAEMMGFDSGTPAVIAGVAAALAFRPVSERLDRMVKGRKPEKAAPRNRRKSDEAAVTVSDS